MGQELAVLCQWSLIILPVHSPYVSHDLVRCQMIYLKTQRANTNALCLQQLWLAKAVTITRSFRLNQHSPSPFYCKLMFLRSPKTPFSLTT